MPKKQTILCSLPIFIALFFSVIQPLTDFGYWVANQIAQVSPDHPGVLGGKVLISASVFMFGFGTSKMLGNYFSHSLKLS